MSDWKPIETAPKDIRVLCFNAFTGVYLSEYSDGEWPMRGWGYLDGTWYPRPTHWMPLPAPPTGDAP